MTLAQPRRIAPALGPMLGLGMTLAACGGAAGGRGTGGTNDAGGDTASLEGPGSFTPNSVLAFLYRAADGGIDTTSMRFVIASSSPPCSCAGCASGRLPDSLDGLLDIGIFGTEVVTIAYPVNSGASCGEGVPFCSTLALDGPASTATTPLASGVSGNVTLTGVGAAKAGMLSFVDGGRYSGTLSATLRAEDGGDWTLSGAFDTGTVCLE